MAEKSFGFNSAGAAPGDRAYTAADYMSWLNTHFGGNNGVISGLLNQLAVTSLGSYVIATNSGGCVYNGYTYLNDASLNKTLDSVATSYKRYDRLVVRFDAATARSAVLTVIKGTASTGTPAIPSLGGSDIALGTVYIDNTSGTPSFTVTDARSYRSLPLADSNVTTTKIADGAVTDAKASGLTSAAMASGYKIRSFDGGSVSGTVVLPAISVGETAIAYYVPTAANVNFNAPGSGTTFMALAMRGSDSSTENTILGVCRKLISGGSTIFTNGASGGYVATFIYTRIS